MIKRSKKAMSDTKEERIFSSSPLPPVLHGVRLSEGKSEKKVQTYIAD
jgi:hypothetical protein